MSKSFTQVNNSKAPMNFQIVGDWEGVAQALEQFPDTIQESAMWGQRKAAEKYIKVVKGHIKKDDLGLAPKKYNSSDARPLINNEDYVNSIKAWRKKGIYFAGIKRGIIHPHAKMETATLAAILEHGTFKGGTPRPVWGPSWKEVGGLKGMRGEVIKAINRKVVKLRTLGFAVKYRTIF